jgi:hypothetical protein
MTDRRDQESEMLEERGDDERLAEREDERLAERERRGEQLRGGWRKRHPSEKDRHRQREE